MISRVMSMGINGIEGFPVTVEVDLASGLPHFEIVGLVGTAVMESRERVRAAIKNAGYRFPVGRITANLAPAGIRKEGPIYDLALAIGILNAINVISQVPQNVAFLGELSLMGEIRPIRGALPMLLAARNAGIKVVVLPKENAREGENVEGIHILGVQSLNELCGIMNHEIKANYLAGQPWTALTEQDDGLYPDDMAFIKGQYGAKRALEVAAAGGHNMLMIGPPGSGKSMLARALPSILPPLNFEEALEVTQIYSVSGELGDNQGLMRQRAVRAPHYTASTVAMTGGGTPIRPGELSLAHCGVLFLDEFPEFQRKTVEALRQPLEDGKVLISRATGNVQLPCRVMLVAAMNPCPCGYYGARSHHCTCSPYSIRNYLNRVSGPMLDRMDLHVEVSEVDYDKLTDKSRGEPSKKIRERVIKARELQKQRFEGTGIFSNAAMSMAELEKYCELDAKTNTFLQKTFTEDGLSARGYSRILKVARTIADLDNSERVGYAHVQEAVQYRALNKKYWGVKE